MGEKVMLGVDLKVFVQIPGESEQRILHPGTIKGTTEEGYTLQLEEKDLSLDAGQDFLLYFEERREFMQQPARINAIMEGEPSLTIGFATTGDPVSAESRECYRVSTALADYVASVADEPSCKLMDVSVTGFSVIAEKNYSIGQSVPVKLFFENREFTGTVTVQSIKQLPTGKIRTGFYSTDPGVARDSLGRGLQTISMAVQRQHLRRQAGTG